MFCPPYSEGMQPFCTFRHSQKCQRGNGAVDNALACYAGGRGSIPVVGSIMSIKNGFSPSGVLELGNKKIGPRHFETVF